MDHLGPDVPLHFTAFHPDWKMRDVPPTPPETLKRARKIAMNAGVHYVYTGNVHDPAGQATYCYACGAVLIGRDWYDMTAWNLSAGGRCGNCGALCHGVFESQAGRWGRRRKPLTILWTEQSWWRRKRRALEMVLCELAAVKSRNDVRFQG